jgi:hypothetical protein
MPQFLGNLGGGLEIEKHKDPFFFPGMIKPTHQQLGQFFVAKQQVYLSQYHHEKIDRQDIKVNGKTARLKSKFNQSDGYTEKFPGDKVEYYYQQR